MIEVAIMIEGQNGLNWERWKCLAQVVEDCGYIGLFRSDHFTNGNPPDIDSLECWTSLSWLATHTQRIEFGPLVSPVSFRHPSILARMATAVDDLSEGRLILGLGAGWQEREHSHFGFDLLQPKERFTRFEEGVQVVSKLLYSDVPVNFTGRYFNLNEAIVLPRPARVGGPPILIGGNGKQRTLPLAAKFAQEWNATFPSLAEFKELNPLLSRYLESENRPTNAIRRSVVAGCIFGTNHEEVERKVNKRTRGQRTIAELRTRGMIVGTGEEIVEQCRAFEDAGAQRIMLQWLDLDDVQGIENMSKGILDKLSR
jgi:F420-dependent oxidoreductase-like protein